MYGNYHLIHYESLPPPRNFIFKHGEGGRLSQYNVWQLPSNTLRKSTPSAELLFSNTAREVDFHNIMYGNYHLIHYESLPPSPKLRKKRRREVDFHNVLQSPSITLRKSAPLARVLEQNIKQFKKQYIMKVSPLRPANLKIKKKLNRRPSRRTNLPVQGLSLSRSQHKDCSTRYSTPTES